MRTTATVRRTVAKKRGRRPIPVRQRCSEPVATRLRKKDFREFEKLIKADGSNVSKLTRKAVLEYIEYHG